MTCRIRRSSLCFLVLLFVGHDEAIGRDPVRLRILSWNIHHGEGTDSKLDLDRIAKVIKDVQPDLVALQEVDKNCARSQSVDQPTELAKLTSLHAVFEKNIPLQGGEYGNAILSRWPIVSHRNHALPCFENGEQRGALIAEINVPLQHSSTADFPLTFISTHLDHRRDDAERIASADQINNIVRQQSSAPKILAGDLNAAPESEVLKTILKQWSNTTITPMPTIPVDRPRTQIDYVLLWHSTQAKVIEYRVLDESVASDHRAVFVVVELNP